MTPDQCRFRRNLSAGAARRMDACRSPVTTCSASASAPRSSTPRPGRADDAAILDLGVQDTGPDGPRGRWRSAARRSPADDLVYAWTLRGAPHAYRRSEAAAVAAAVAPLSEADAAKRVFDASKPLKDAGIPVARRARRDRRRDARHRPPPDGEGRDVARARRAAAGAVPPLVPGLRGHPLLRADVPAVGAAGRPRARARHVAAGAAPDPGLARRSGEGRPSTSTRSAACCASSGRRRPSWSPGTSTRRSRRSRRTGPRTSCRSRSTASALDPRRRRRRAAPTPAGATAVRLLGPFDLFLQGRDRELVLPDAAARKDLWRTIGRPGAVLVGHEVVGSWRPRSSGKKLRIAVNLWSGGGRRGARRAGRTPGRLPRPDVRRVRRLNPLPRGI